jgi:hypothetical protein
VSLETLLATLQGRSQVEHKDALPEVATPAIPQPQNGFAPTDAARRLDTIDAAGIELKAEAGEDWPAIRDNPEAVKQLALALREDREIEAGTCPERWSETAVCSRCGPVFVPPWLAGCRWCAPRRQGVAIPRPTR